MARAHCRSPYAAKGQPGQCALAWLTWLAVPILYLIDLQNRLLVLTRWAFSFLTRGRSVRLIGTPLDLGVNLAPPERHDVRACRPLAGDHCHTAEPKPGSSGPNLLQPCGSPTLLANRCCRLTRGARLRYPHATASASARRTCATSEDTVRYYELPMSRALLNVRAPQSPPNDEESRLITYSSTSPPLPREA